jgi:hypothetical protein
MSYATGCHTVFHHRYAQSAMGVYEPIGGDQPPLGFNTYPADTQTYHIQFVGNVMYENSCNQTNVGIPGGHDCGTHTDGNGIILDEQQLSTKRLQQSHKHLQISL